MSYIGATPAESYASFYVQHFTTSATTSYALDYPVVNENDLRLVINNVVQQPGSGYSYTAAASTLTLSAATTTSDTMYAVFLGRALQTVNPPGDSVGVSQLADTVISGQTALGAEPADTDEFLVSDAGTLKRMDYSYIKAGSSDFVKLATYTASDDATLEMDGDFTADYKTYLYVINELVPATSNKTLYIRYRQSDADVTGSNYKYQIGQMYYDSGGSASITTEGGYNTTFAKLTMGDGVNNLTEGCCGRIMLFNPLGTVARKYYTTEIFSQRTNEETMQTRMGGGLYDANNTALSGITLYWDAGNVTSGTVSVYGLKP